MSLNYPKKPLIFIGCGLLALILLCIAGVGGLVFFIFSSIKNSEPGQLTTQFARQSQALHEILGDIQGVGWPFGSISVEGSGSGEASFSISLRGTQAQGKLFTTLRKVNGQWHVVSSRLQLEDGRSFELGGSPGAPAPLQASSQEKSHPPATRRSGGKQLRADRNVVAQWRHVDWPGQQIGFDVPADWMELSLEKKEIEFRPQNRKAYFIGRLNYFNQKIPFDSLIESIAHSAAAELKREEIAGYTFQNFGKAHGLLKISSRRDGHTMAVWIGYFDTLEFGTASVNLLFGAPSKADFERAEPILGAILESIQFPSP